MGLGRARKGHSRRGRGAPLWILWTVRGRYTSHYKTYMRQPHRSRPPPAQQRAPAWPLAGAFRLATNPVCGQQCRRKAGPAKTCRRAGGRLRLGISTRTRAKRATSRAMICMRYVTLGREFIDTRTIHSLRRPMSGTQHLHPQCDALTSADRNHKHHVLHAVKAMHAEASLLMKWVVQI